MAAEGMQQVLSEFRDPELAKKLVAAINHYNPGTPIRLMEVCGTHTASIAKAGIKGLLPENISLISGPGCPVCVTANEDIDRVIALSRIPNVVITTFGDMTRVPGSTSSLLKEQAAGADVRICYSPIDALNIAQANPDKEIVFVGVGFETTTPLIAATIKRAKALGLTNFSVMVAHKNMPGAIEGLINDPEVNVQGMILPGHVSTIIGKEPYEFIAAKYHIPGVITGFEPVDILTGIEMLVRQLAEGRAEIENAYGRGVNDDGNPAARDAIGEVFETCTSTWRGLGPIEGSGYALKAEYADFDALKKFAPEVEETREHKGCRCDIVLRGIITPKECPLFRKVCTPENPVGPCMVSSEGSCAAYYRYY